jgi:hypothetical protein
MQVRDLARLRGELTAHVLFSIRTAVEAVGPTRSALPSPRSVFCSALRP